MPKSSQINIYKIKAYTFLKRIFSLTSASVFEASDGQLVPLVLSTHSEGGVERVHSAAIKVLDVHSQLIPLPAGQLVQIL